MRDCWERGLPVTCCCYGYRRAGLVCQSGLNGACSGASRLLLYLVHQFATMNGDNALSAPITEKTSKFKFRNHIRWTPLTRTRLFRILEFPDISNFKSIPLDLSFSHLLSIGYSELPIFRTIFILPPESSK